MNYIKKFMDDNGIEVNEEFYVINEKGEKIENTYDGESFLKFHFTENLEFKSEAINLICTKVLLSLMLGKCKIEKIPHKPKTVWDLKEGDEYWYITLLGYVEEVSYQSDDEDINIIKAGNAFLTKEEAEFEVERRKCEAILLKYGTRDMMSFGDGNKSKYCLYLNNFLNKIIVSDNYCVQSQGTIYFESKELAQKAIKECGENRLKKYVFNVNVPDFLNKKMNVKE